MNPDHSFRSRALIALEEYIAARKFNNFKLFNDAVYIADVVL
jgi:hypothetical protein